MIAIPREVVFATIYKNQTWTLWILGDRRRADGRCSGFLLGHWFIRPLLEIIDVTRQLHAGQLYNRTHVKRGDELGDLADARSIRWSTSFPR